MYKAGVLSYTSHTMDNRWSRVDRVPLWMVGGLPMRAAKAPRAPVPDALPTFWSTVPPVAPASPALPAEKKNEKENDVNDDDDEE